MSSAPSSGDSPRITPTSGGSILPVRVRPGGRSTGTRGLHVGALKIEVNAPPEDRKANRAVLAFLAETLQVRKTEIEIRTGAHSKEKTIFIPLEPSALRARLVPFLKGNP